MTGEDGARAAVAALSAAFAARDVDRTLSCFTGDSDISYVGSEAGEAAHGRQEVRGLLVALFSRPEAYSWQATRVTVHAAGDVLHVVADAAGRAVHDDGDAQTFTYRLTGLLQPDGDAWRWRVCAGTEPR